MLLAMISVLTLLPKLNFNIKPFGQIKFIISNFIDF